MRRPRRLAAIISFVRLRRWIALAFSVAVVGLVGGAVAWVVMAPLGGPAVVVRSAAGGFEVSLPKGWVLRDIEPDDPYTWVQADRPNRIGRATAWFWLGRGAPVGDDPLGFIRSFILDDVESRWGEIDVEVSDVRLDGLPAVRVHFRRPLVEMLGFAPAGDVEEVRYAVVSADQVYTVGIGAWRGLPSETRSIIRDLRFAPPSGQRDIDEPSLGIRLQVPSTWNESEMPRDDLPRARWVATAPPDPPTHWAIIWAFDEPLRDVVAASARDAERRGVITARSTARVDGRRATRIDFERDAPTGRRSYFSTWLIDGPDGRSWQLLVGSLHPDRTVAEGVSRGLTFAD